MSVTHFKPEVEKTSAPDEDTNVDKNNFWGKKSHYIIYCLMLGNIDTMVNWTIDITSNLSSGGALVLCLISSTFFLVLPLVCMETFLGRYTKKTNIQMYTMAPLFIGYSYILLILNFIFIPIESTHIGFYMLEWLHIMGNTSSISTCYHLTNSCYDYKLLGPLHDDCEKTYMGMDCKEHGFVRYPMQYNYWHNYLSDGYFPTWKIALTVCFIWLVVWIIVFLRLKMAGTILLIAFIMHFISSTLLLIVSLSVSGDNTGMYKVTSIDLSKLTFNEFLSITLVAFRRAGLLFPMGHMSYSSRLQEKTANNFLFVFLGLLYGVYLLIVTLSICGVIGLKLGVDVWNVVETEMALFMVIIPEFLGFMKSPMIYIVYVYFCAVFKEIIMLAISVIMFVNNIIDVFPSMVKFEKYAKGVVCIAYLLISLSGMNQTAAIYVIPIMKKVNLLTGTAMLLFMESVMVFYIYGIKRLSDDMYFMLGQKPNAFVRLTWGLLPIIFLAIFIVMIWVSKSLILQDVYVKSYQTFTLTTYIYYGVFGVAFVISLIYLFCQLGKRNVCERILKPKFYWGPPNRIERIGRKAFSPSTLIPSQPPRKRKYRTVLMEDAAKVVHLEDKWKSAKETDDLEKALKGAEEDESAPKLAAKIEEKKGRIFADTEYFGNLGDISHVYMKRSGKVRRFDDDEVESRSIHSRY